MRILDMLFPPREDELLLRPITTDVFTSFLAPTHVPATRPGTTALLPFHTPEVRAAIHEAKYHGNRQALRLLGSALATYISTLEKGPASCRLVPIPLSAARHRERGFNQVERVMREAITCTPFPVDTHVLTRTRDTVSQVSLPRRSREENMRGAFSATRPIDSAVTYILIDDVLTTGATLQAAIDALNAAGAKNITSIALAH